MADAHAPVFRLSFAAWLLRSKRSPAPLPSWDRDGSIHRQAAYAQDERSLRKISKPDVNTLCSPLLHGSPEPADARRLYREAIVLVALFRDRVGLVAVAGYRRQLASLDARLARGLPDVDKRLLKAVWQMRRELKPDHIRDIGRRMPERSWIRTLLRGYDLLYHVSG